MEIRYECGRVCVHLMDKSMQMQEQRRKTNEFKTQTILV